MSFNALCMIHDYFTLIYVCCPSLYIQSKNTRDAIIMGANRIGHGTLLESDPLTLEYARSIHFPIVCNLISNQKLGAFLRGYSNHPSLNFFCLGLSVSQSTDDEGVFRTTITDDCIEIISHTDIQYTELLSMSRNTVESSFASEDLKRKLVMELDSDAAEFVKKWGDPAEM